MSDYQSPVDEPPGKDGHQGQANPDEVFPVPVYEPGANPAGTHPPVASENDPATTPPPGSIPGSGGEPAAEPTAPPVNVAVPYAEQVLDRLTCTMGIWDNEPTSYAWQWQLDGVDFATGDTVTITAAEAGKTAVCVLTATNSLGSATAPPSNSVVVTAP